MKRAVPLLLAAGMAAAAFAEPPKAAGRAGHAEEVAAVSRLVDDWHDAAAKADEARYFGHMADDAVFLGTDATERWTKASFREWAKPYFAKGRAWTFLPRDRKVSLDPSRNVAWFDELLDSKSYGVCRGSGVAVRVKGAWKLAQYNLSIPIPNELAKDFVARIAERPR